MAKLAPEDIAKLDPYKFMAVVGKRVIHPGGRASTDELLARANITADSRVLDVGCGVATTAVEIARRHQAQVTAVDIAPLMLERAEANVAAAHLAERVSVAHGDILEVTSAMPPSTWSSPRRSPCSWTAAGLLLSWPGSPGPADDRPHVW